MRAKDHKVTSFVRAALAAIVICLGFGGVAAAQGAWPDRPIRMLISFPPGGSSDAIARIVQPGLEKRLGQPLVIENRPGAGGMIAIDAVARATPDGYTIGLGGAGALGGNVALGEKMSYDPRKDVAPVTVLSGSPFILAAAPSFAGKSVPDIIALSKREKIAIGHGGNGTLMHLTAEMFNQMARHQVAAGPVPRHCAGRDRPDWRARGAGIVDPPSAVAAIEGGKIKAVAISSAARFPRLKDVPTFAEQGLPEFEVLRLVRHRRAGQDAARGHRKAQRGAGRGAEGAVGCGTHPRARRRTDAADAGGILRLHPARDRQMDQGGRGLRRPAEVRSADALQRRQWTALVPACGEKGDPDVHAHCVSHARGTSVDPATPHAPSATFSQSTKPMSGSPAR